MGKVVKNALITKAPAMVRKVEAAPPSPMSESGKRAAAESHQRKVPGGKDLFSKPVKINFQPKVEGRVLEDPDGADLLDKHILDDVAVLDGPLTLRSMNGSSICFIEIEPKTNKN
ncbi:MAG: hypothetical protein GKR89_20720 [Candidatus Latescibacteria bacterium]|nr:hypothetical protein [Candidatus Latescibacterota bacterium]